MISSRQFEKSTQHSKNQSKETKKNGLLCLFSASRRFETVIS